MKSEIVDTLVKLLTDPLKLSAALAAVVMVCALAFFWVRAALRRRGLLTMYVRVLAYVWRYRLFFCFTVVFSFAMAVFSSGRLVLGEPFITQFLQERDYSVAVPMVLTLAGLAAGVSVCSFLKTYFHQFILGRIYVDMRTDAANNLLGLSLDFYNREKAGELLSRLTNDVLVAQKSVDFILGDIIEKPAMIFICTLLIFLSCWQLGLIVFVGFPLIIFPIKWLGKRIRKYSSKSLRRQAGATQAINQAFSGIRVVKAFGMEEEEKKEFHRENEGYFRKFLGVIRAKAISHSFTELASNIGAAALLWLCFYLLMNNHWGLTAGKIIVIAGAAAFIYQPAKSLVKAYNKLQESMAGAKRVFELMDYEPTVKDAPGASVLPRFEREIVFDGVTFAYDRESVVKDINLKVKSGETIAIVGPSGAGKSTLLNLIPRFYDPRQGAVLIDGHDISRVKIKSILDQIAIVTQEPFLFHTTIRKNICYGKRDASEEEITAAARAANAHDFIVNELPEGYDTVVGERGARLSGGQCQRLTIARAILKNPSILLLDEATSSLDSEAEHLVQEALTRLMRHRTTFVIAHRLSTVMHADRIVVLDLGKIVGIGKHDEILKSCSQYRNLYLTQFKHTTTQQFLK